MSHTKEPWGHVDSRVYFPNIAGGFDLRACPNPEDNARRIVACACLRYGTHRTITHRRRWRSCTSDSCPQRWALWQRTSGTKAHLKVHRLRLTRSLEWRTNWRGRGFNEAQLKFNDTGCRGKGHQQMTITNDQFDAKGGSDE